MYRVGYPTPWVVMGRGSSPAPYAVTYYPEIIPCVGYEQSVSNMSALLNSTSLDASAMQDYSPKKPPWPNKQTNKSYVNGNNTHFSDNSSSCSSDFTSQHRSSMSSSSTTSSPAESPTVSAGDGAPGNEKRGKNHFRSPVYNRTQFRPFNLYGKGTKRQKSGRRSSSPCSDTDVEVLCKKKFNDAGSTTPPVSRNLSTCSSPTVYHALSNRHLKEPIYLKGNEWDQLSREIWNKFLANKQTDETYNCKMRLHGALYELLLQHFPTCSLFVVGSSMNGFGCNTSDIDMCLMLQHDDMDQTVDAINILKHIQKVLKHCDYVQKVELIRAKVPILKFKDCISGCEVDLNINNSVGIRNTHLLYQYAKLDPRVRPLVQIVKMWARAHDINDAKNMTVSSYSLTLMVIHYLQVGCHPHVLPCLNKHFPKKFLPDTNVKSLRLEESFHLSLTDNNQSLGELLVGFFNYYCHFQFSDQAISVRLGQRIPKCMCQYQKSKKNNPGQWKFLCIEEPFDLTNTARSVYDYDVFSRIEQVFRTSYQNLQLNKSIKSILQ